MTREMLRCQRVSAAALCDFDIGVTRARAAEESAAEREHDARNLARKIVSAAEAKAEAAERRAEQRAANRMEEIVSERRAAHEAEHAARILKEVSAVRASYADTKGWLVDLVVTSIERVIGERPGDEAQLKVIEDCLSRFGRNWSLGIKAATPDVARLRALADAHPALFEAVEGIEADPTLDAGSIHLFGNACGFEIGLPARIDALKSFISAELDDDDADA